MGIQKEMTQDERILEYMRAKGHIDTWTAIKEFGVTRLSAVIHRLRHKLGIKITDEWHYAKNRYGEPVKYKRYILPDGFRMGLIDRIRYFM